MECKLTPAQQDAASRSAFEASIQANAMNLGPELFASFARDAITGYYTDTVLEQQYQEWKSANGT